MPRKNENSDLKALAILGGIGLALMVMAPAIWLIWTVMTRPAESPAPDAKVPTASGPVGALGELDSTCGGPNRLPCRPGLKCSNANDFSKTGVCEKDLVSQPGARTYRQLGEACGYSFPQSEDCAPGLVCRMANASSTRGLCAKAEKTSPQILKAKLEGAEPSGGEYLVSAKTGLSYSVETANAEVVRALWSPDKGSPGETKLLRQAGGMFSNPLKGNWRPGATGTLTFRAFAEDGSFAILDYRLSSRE